MLSYDEVMSFSEDAEIGFVQLDDAARKRMYENSGDHYGWGPARTYITFIFAYIDENNINIDINRNVPIGGDAFSDYFAEFINTIDYFKSRLIFRQKNNTKNGITTSLYLNDGYKEEINGLLNKIKSITYNTKLPDKKKDAIFNKINALSGEVDRVLTRTDALLSLYLDVTNAIGEGVENLEPLFSRVERLMKLFGRAKAEQESGKLPPPAAKKLLSPPAEDGERVGGGGDLDDEIPF